MFCLVYWPRPLSPFFGPRSPLPPTLSSSLSSFPPLPSSPSTMTRRRHNPNYTANSRPHHQPFRPQYPSRSQYPSRPHYPPRSHSSSRYQSGNSRSHYPPRTQYNARPHYGSPRPQYHSRSRSSSRSSSRSRSDSRAPPPPSTSKSQRSRSSERPPPPLPASPTRHAPMKTTTPFTRLSITTHSTILASRKPVAEGAPWRSWCISLTSAGPSAPETGLPGVREVRYLLHGSFDDPVRRKQYLIAPSLSLHSFFSFFPFFSII